MLKHLLHETKRGSRSVTITAERLMELAEQGTRLANWGPDLSFQIGLEKIIDSLFLNDPTSATVDRFSDHMVRLLETRLRLVEDERLHPEICEVQIPEPVIGIGLARTGTSILLDLLALDPTARAPQEWEVESLWPAPEAKTYTTDPRIAAAQAKHDAMYEAIPALRTMRPDPRATGPADCLQLLNLHFASTGLMSGYIVPEYADWLATERAEGLYRTHRRAVQQMAWKGPQGRWSMKEPMHLLNLDLLFEAYPDARLIQTHRDPLETFPSTASLIWTVQTLADPNVDKKKIGRMVMQLFGAHLERATRAREDPKLDARVLDIPYRDTVADPVGQCRRIHSHFDIPFSEEHAERIRHHIEMNPQGKHGRHEYSAEEFGMTREELEGVAPSYRKRFGHVFS
jgi:Sulfotransferase family